MQLLHAPCAEQVTNFLQDLLTADLSFEATNEQLRQQSGIIDFFTGVDDWQTTRDELTNRLPLAEEHNAAEYGDFQTSESLAKRLCATIAEDGFAPTILLEPTCGQGNFLLAALRQFPDVKAVYGVEIYKPYLYQCKFQLLNYFLENRALKPPAICLLHQSVFDTDFGQLIRRTDADKLLIVGNPPWVTNAGLGVLSSQNLPEKTNFKRLTGLDALTGKSNFDIAEFVIIQLLRTFHQQPGQLALLVKNTVIKNIVEGQPAAGFAISRLQKRVIDAKKEFGVSADAALFMATLAASEPAQMCQEIPIPLPGSTGKSHSFGWTKNKFVSNLEAYQSVAVFDGRCPFEWRQGLKHDCSAVMELSQHAGHYASGVTTDVELESGLVYPMYKSSDLRQPIAGSARRFTIVTQKRIGQDTAYIKEQFPLTHSYLKKQETLFANRKSSIYRGKPQYSIFGIGDYSFKPYKVAISALYKEPVFSLVLPTDSKPAMLDDTCYFLGFDELSEALITMLLLNHPLTYQLLQAITFADAKRVFTKDVLMRVDLGIVKERLTFNDIRRSIPDCYHKSLCLNDWLQYLSNQIQPIRQTQLTLF